MIPIKKPNISTNRYKELLRTEKYCDKLEKEYFDYIETSRNRMEKLCDEIGDLDERIDKATEYILNNKLYHFEYDDEELFEITTDKKAKDDLLEILKGSE